MIFFFPCEPKLLPDLEPFSWFALDNVPRKFGCVRVIKWLDKIKSFHDFRKKSLGIKSWLLFFFCCFLILIEVEKIHYFLYIYFRCLFLILDVDVFFECTKFLVKVIFELLSNSYILKNVFSSFHVLNEIISFSEYDLEKEIHE